MKTPHVLAEERYQMSVEYSTYSGEYAKLIFKYKKIVIGSIKPLFIGITIRNDSDVIQTVIATDELGISLEIEKEEGVIEVEIPEVLLRGGMYSVTFQISYKANQIASHEIIDRVENAMYFQVERGDYWSVGNINRPTGYLQQASIILK